MAEAPKGFLLDLKDTPPGDSASVTNFFQCHLLSRVESEAQADNLFLARGEMRQGSVDLLAQVFGFEHLVGLGRELEKIETRQHHRCHLQPELNRLRGLQELPLPNELRPELIWQFAGELEETLFLDLSETLRHPL